MGQKKREHPVVKSKLHPRNKHRARYDFKLLIEGSPALAEFVVLNKHGDESIDFSNPAAVKMLNKALLKQHYDIEHWDIPEGYLCPPIPGRADYLHYVADLLRGDFFGKFPEGKTIRCLDIGVGANCVYPILGVKEYGWSFLGTDIDPVALQSAQKIVDSNPALQGHVELRLQSKAKDIFYGILLREDRFDLSICNPPFHASLEDAQAGTRRKISNLKGKKISKTTLNFGGKGNELWCDGGEKKFVAKMIRESKKFSESCRWFTTLISKQTHLKGVYAALEMAKATDVRTIPMGQGNKVSRIVAWTFLEKKKKARTKAATIV